MPNISRRDFLKLSAAALGSLALRGAAPSLANMATNKDKPNVLILLFDTTSAPHLSLYGYPRKTTPNLDRFSERATIYHSHYSSGTYTVPGTASILTGLYPWTHRALNPAAPIRRDLEGNNLFRAVGRDYYRVGYGQNLWADVFLRQFHEDLDLHLPATSFAYANPLLLGETTESDWLPYLAYDDYLVGGVKLDTPYAGSITLGILDIALGRGRHFAPELKNANAWTLPYNNYNFYSLHSIFQGILETVTGAASVDDRPYFGYFHLWAPHGPYAPEPAFRTLFDDEIKARRKERHPLIEKKFAVRDKRLIELARSYNQYIANVDAEFGYLMDNLESKGLLDNTCVVILSDHGQLFERGVHGHSSPLLYDQGIHVPLVISMPGQTQRVDVHEPTSNVDLLPTLAAITGGKTPERLEGRILPGLNLDDSGTQPVFCMDAKLSSAFGPMKTASLAIFREPFKLTLYKGYDGFEDIVELYNLKEDPDEMRDLSAEQPSLKTRLLDELLAALNRADQPFHSRRASTI